MGLRTLNVHTPWTEVLAAVDAPVAPDQQALPARVRCPVCAGHRLGIYDDTISGGAWHYCFDCRRGGDMIELAAAAWGVSPGVAVRRLAAEGFPIPEGLTDAATIKKYTTTYPRKRARMLDLFVEAAKYLPRAGGQALTHLRTRFRLAADIPAERWLAGPGNMVGAYPYMKVELAFYPKGMDTGRFTVSPWRRVFPGRGWGDVLVVPHHDLPGRVCGFTFVGRGGEAADRRFKATRPRLAGRPAEGGLTCFWAVDNSHGMLGEHVVACDDTFLALRLHVRHFATARTALPLVAFTDTPDVRTERAWQALGGKTPVFWGWRVTPGLVYQAVRAEGKLVLSDLTEVTPARVDHFVRNNEPRALLKKLVEAARPWRSFLIDWAERVNDGLVAELLLGLEGYGVRLSDLTALGPRFAQVMGMRGRPREVMVGKYVVVEKDGKWWTGEKASSTGRRGGIPSTLIMNATLRIDGTETRPTGHKTPSVYYRGRLTYQGTEIPFVTPVRSVGDKIAVRARLQTALAIAKPGALLYTASGWGGRRLIEAGTLFAGVA